VKPRRGRIFLTVALAALLSGCLSEPEIDERWTLVQFVDSRPTPGQTASGGQAIPVTVKGRVTYRRILTGFLVAEMRYASGIAPASVSLNPEEANLETAQSVDQILANSVTVGRATRAVTGFDHLIQEINLSFTAQVPAMASGGLYLLLYLGSGEEVELSTGEDSLIVTPFVSTRGEILHSGFPVAP